MNPWGVAFVAIGLFSAAAGALDWEFFMNNRKAQFMCSIFGRGGARIFYVLLGLAFVVLGVLFVTGVIKDTNP